MSTIRAFLRSAKSTSETQALLEEECFANSDVSLAVVAIAIASYSIDSMLIFLSETGLFDISERGFSGLLGKFGYRPSSLSQRAFVDMCCATYESAVFLMKKEGGNSHVFFINLALCSAVQIALMAGCQTLALGVIQGLKELDTSQHTY